MQKPKRRRGQRISAETDYNILADLALGLTSKEIAAKYKVSISYVSKVRTGRKKIDVYIPEQTKQANKIAYYESDIDKIDKFFQNTQLTIKDNTEDLDSLIIQKITELKVLLSIRRKLKKEDKE